MVLQHDKYMLLALVQAEKAGLINEVPVGAVLVDEKGRILSADHNRTIEMCDPCAHAEILALRAAAARVNSYRLVTCTLYTTVEPCLMCMGALVHARVATVVYGAKDAKWGAAGSLYNFADDIRLNHRINIVSGVHQKKCKEIMQAFFREKRRAQSQSSLTTS